MSELDLQTLVREQTPFVWRVLRHLGVLENQLDDLSQEVFMVLVENPSAFEARSSLRTFLYGVCRNIARSARRRRTARRETELEPSAQGASEATQERALWLKESRARLVEVIAELNEEQRMIFVLYEIEELSMEEIASALNAPLRTCYSRLEVARKQVLARFRRKHATARPIGLEVFK
jgi:RNA polymerase sigma-70 factor (ECF subfamily)